MAINDYIDTVRSAVGVMDETGDWQQAYRIIETLPHLEYLERCQVLSKLPADLKFRSVIAAPPQRPPEDPIDLERVVDARVEVLMWIAEFPNAAKLMLERALEAAALEEKEELVAQLSQALNGDLGDSRLVADAKELLPEARLYATDYVDAIELALAGQTVTGHPSGDQLIERLLVYATAKDCVTEKWFGYVVLIGMTKSYRVASGPESVLAGLFGLSQAVDKFYWWFGKPFVPQAIWWIRKSMATVSCGLRGMTPNEMEILGNLRKTSDWEMQKALSEFEDAAQSVGLSTSELKDLVRRADSQDLYQYHISSKLLAPSMFSIEFRDIEPESDLISSDVAMGDWI